MRPGLVLIGIILMFLGGIPLSEVYFPQLYIPYLMPLVNLLYKIVPIDGFILSVILLVAGFIIFIAGLKASKMGKYYNYYGN
ncbi:MAG: hypothetical protein RAK22_00800 [Nanoarchaeota archaeon]|nr:hypothetical protein [Nanoarchaeota archaeon]